MAQQKGHTGNPNGRPKGAPNKVTTTIRNWIVELINDNREQLQKDLKSLDPKDRLECIGKLLPYILPKVDRADEVKGAAYSDDDIIESPLDICDFSLSTRKVRNWVKDE